MNFVDEEFTKKFRIVGNFYKYIWFLEQKPAEFQIHIATEKRFDGDSELLRLNRFKKL